MVIVILSIITIATIPIVRPALDTRRIREAARMLAAHITEAQAHAVETGRPAGVWIERLRLGSGTSATVEPAAAMDLYLCEVPPPYSGDTSNSACTVAVTPNGTQPNVVTTPGGPPQTVAKFQGSFTLTNFDASWVGLLRPGDLIQFSYRGSQYRLLEPQPPATVTVDSNGFYQPPTPPTLATFTIEPAAPTDFVYDYSATPPTPVTPVFRCLPPLASTGGWTTPFQILRQPIKLSTTPLQLPAGTVIDLFYSGVGSAYFAQAAKPGLKFTKDPGPFGFTFSPSGALDKLYYIGISEPLSQPVYLLLGKREKVARDAAAFDQPASLDPAYATADSRETQTEKHNFRDLENLWVSINPQTGLVSTAEVAELPAPTGSTTPPTHDQAAYDELEDALGQAPTPEQTIANAARISRQFATSAQTMGGR